MNNSDVANVLKENNIDYYIVWSTKNNQLEFNIFKIK